ncbi:MAG: hypothetical protein FJ139_03380 [Deltaproteobacteria bacterium]|nr:hypothetical protein [Deltaproteobacteria bacterium]
MLYGIQAAKDVKLSNITRSLNEPLPLIKTEDRLSRNLGDRDFTEAINHQICRLGSRNVLDDMVIAIDPGDIRKKYAAKMEGLCKIHDWSEHEIGEGYWLAKAVAADIDHKRVIPLYLEVYSQDAEGFISENDQLFKLIDTISTHVGHKWIYAIDRGGDRGKLYDKFLEEGKRFVIRLTQKRDLIHKGLRKNGRSLATLLPCPYQTVIIKYQDGQEDKTTVSYNALPVKLPGRQHPLFLVVVKGFGKVPMMLLTSCPVKLKSKECIWRIVEIYLTRWKCDESFRYIKQCYNLEDIRVRHYTSIRNMVVLILAVSYFAAVYLGENLKLKMLVERIYLVSKRFFGVPTFFNYVIADGLYNLLFADKTGVKIAPKNKNPDFQLCFNFCDEMG